MGFGRVFAIFWLFLSGSELFAQNKVILINGDTLRCQMIKMSSTKINFKEDGIERELATELVSKMVLQGGRETTFHDIPSTLDFGKQFQVLKYSDEMASEIRLLFPKSLRRVYTVKHLSSTFTAPVELFLAATQGSGEHSDAYLREFTTFGYGCNAFLALVNSRPGEIQYTFYSNPVKAQKIRDEVIHRSYKLVDSQTIGAIVGLADMTLKAFTMSFKENGVCDFIQDDKVTVLEYQVSEDGLMTFRDPKKRNKGTTYAVVFFGIQSMRYTQFSSVNDNLITRKVEVINTIGN